MANIDYKDEDRNPITCLPTEIDAEYEDEGHLIKENPIELNWTQMSEHLHRDSRFNLQVPKNNKEKGPISKENNLQSKTDITELLRLHQRYSHI